MSGTEVVFSVTSSVELGVINYYLTEERCNHIVLGHRDLRNIIRTVVEETVRNPTHVHRSNYDVNRYQFVSYNVKTPGGHPMDVIIEIKDTLGEIITASPKKTIQGVIVWDQATGLYVSYDVGADVLYVSSGDARTAYATDDTDDARIWLRFRDEDDSAAGVTVFQAVNIWREKRQQLTTQISTFLGASQDDVERRITRFLG
jgi:hypothetical protein